MAETPAASMRGRLVDEVARIVESETGTWDVEAAEAVVAMLTEGADFIDPAPDTFPSAGQIIARVLGTSGDERLDFVGRLAGSAYAGWMCEQFQHAKAFRETKRMLDSVRRTLGEACDVLDIAGQHTIASSLRRTHGIPEPEKPIRDAYADNGVQIPAVERFADVLYAIAMSHPDEDNRQATMFAGMARAVLAEVQDRG